MHVYIVSMSQRPGSTSVQSVETLRLQMERSVDDLAELARSNVEPGQFFAEVLRRALQPGGATHAVLWRHSLEGTWELAGEMPTGDSISALHLQERQGLLVEIAQTSQPRILGLLQGSNSQAAGGSQVFSPLRHAGQTVGILETQHGASVGESLPAATYQFFAAVGEITADYLSQQELQQLRLAKATWQQWDRYSNQLGQSLELSDVCAVVANDGRNLLGCDRISVLVRRGGGYRLHAASGG